MIGTRLGHHRILEKLGSGAMGEVYLAEDLRLRRKVALKLLPRRLGRHRERLARFRREAEAIASLNHPHVVTIFSIDEATDGDHAIPFLTMEWIDGLTLDQVVPEAGLSPPRLLELARQLLSALGAAHARGVVHRDLKPSNIMIDGQGRAKVLDFGLAKLQAGDGTGHLSTEETALQPGVGSTEPDAGSRREDSIGRKVETLTETGTVLGTVPYMSPEQLRGEPVDHRSDLFSLGVVLYEAATGRRPFRGSNRAEVMTAILRDQPEPLRSRRPDLPRGLAEALMGCLEKEPPSRPRSCEQVLGELTVDRDERPPAASPRPPASVAVMPFADLSAQRDQAYLCEGVAEEIIHTLARVDGLRVISRSASFQIASSGDLHEVGRRLGVASILEGSVRRAGDRVRVTAQLVDTTDGYHLWSQRFDRRLDDVFAIQDEIAAATAEALAGVLTDQQRRVLRRSAAADTRAWEYYLRGRHFFYRKNRQGFEFARRMFNRAIDLDPGYARAFAGIADCCSFLFLWWGHDPRDRDQAASASAKALELAPELAETHASRGLALSICGEDAEAEREFQVALEFDPDQFDTLYLYARTRYAGGELEGAARLFARAARVEETDYQSLILLAQTYQALGKKEPAANAYRRGLARAEARLDLNPDDGRALYLGGAALVYLGETSRGLEWADRALAIDPDDPFILWNVACTNLLAGRIDPALDLLERATDLGFGHREWIEHDPDCDPLRDHPRFLAMLARMARRENALGGTTQPTSIAVLPFVDMSPAGDQRYFCQGLAEELINALTRVGGLQVASRTSSFQFEGAGLDVREIGERLGVRHVLEGSVRKAGDDLRVNAQVIDVTNGFTLWAESFDRRLEAVFAIQREIAEQTVEALCGVITETEKAVLIPPSTRDHAAYDLYLRGRQLFYDGGREATAEARRLFHRAIETDPEYAVAWAGLADACSFLALYGQGGDPDRERALEASQRAVELAPELAEARAARGLALSLVPRYEDAERELVRALEINPRLFEALYLFGRVCFAQGHYREAEELYRRATEVRPEHFQSFTLLAKALRGQDRASEAVAVHEHALALADHRLELRPTDARALGTRASALVELGKVEAGIAAARAARQVQAGDPILYYAACALARGGAVSEALDCLEEVVAGGWAHWDWLRWDRDVDSLRQEPRFQALAEDQEARPGPGGGV